MVDPTDEQAVSAAVVSYVGDHLGIDDVALTSPIRSAGAGMSTFIWFFTLRGTALPSPWKGDLVLRLHPHPNEAEVNAREAMVQSFVAAHDYPAPLPLVAETSLEGETNPFGLPFMIMPRAPGRLILEALTSRPWTAPRLLRTMAELQVRLHALPIDACPLPYDGPLIDRMLTRLDAMAASGGWDDLGATLAWLHTRADEVRDETPVLLHNDFHPLNVLVADDATMAVIDWSDADVGDRHCDVARSVALFWVASVAAESPIERAALRAARSWLARFYRRAYERGHALDDRRLTYWQVVHLFRGHMQVLELQEGSRIGRARAAATDQIPAELAPKLGARAAAMCARFDQSGPTIAS